MNTGDALCVFKSEGSFRVKNRDEKGRQALRDSSTL